MLLCSQRADARPPVVAQRGAVGHPARAAVGRGDAGAGLGGLFGGAPDVLAQLQDFIVTRAGGNPLFVEEIVRASSGRGVLVRGRRPLEVHDDV